MDCNHIIGLASGGDCEDSWTGPVEVGSTPEASEDSFNPCAFCPKCGVSVASEATAYQALLDELESRHRAEWSARPKSRIDMAFEEEAAKMICEISRSGVSRVSSLILKDQLPKEPDQP